MDKFYLILMTCARLPAGKRIRVRVPFRTISTSRFSLSKRQMVFLKVREPILIFSIPISESFTVRG